MSQTDELEQPECPLCMEPLEVDDLNFFPCTCGYQICRFCWHRIRTDENGLCPACRKAYPENPADFKPLSQEQVVKMKAEKRHKEQQKKQKATEGRKHLANVRVVQKNLVFVVGLPMRLADPAMLKKHDYFGKFGKIHKVVINQSNTYAGGATVNVKGPSASAYVTYSRCDDALRAIQAVNNISVDSRVLKTSLGTTKYCSHFIKRDTEASFTKEEMQQGKHQEYEKKLHDQLNLVGTIERKTASPPQGAKTDTWPSLNINGIVTPIEPETKPVPAAPSNQTTATGKGKRHGKEKIAQEKGKRKGKEKHENQSDSSHKPHPLQSSQSETCIKSHALQTSQSESCINSTRGNHTNRSSMVFENSSIYSNGTINNNSNTGNTALPVISTLDVPSPSVSPGILSSQTQLHNGYHDAHTLLLPSLSPSPQSLPPTPPSPPSLPSPPEEHIMPDDELGFDPFQETQKGLADLLEKELALQQQKGHQPHVGSYSGHPHAEPTVAHSLYNMHSYQTPPPSHHLDPAILTQIHSNQQHRLGAVNSSRLDRRAAMPPPGFSAPLPPQPTSSQPPLLHAQHDVFGRFNGISPVNSGLNGLNGMNSINGTKPHQSFYFNNSVPKLSDWPENLRNLVHDGNSHNHTGHPLLQSLHHNPISSVNRLDKVNGWSNASNFADWTALDPAIVSTRPMGINVHSPPPNLYNPGLNSLGGYNGLGSMGALGVPNWTQHYQDAYYKTHIHNTSVPPPGFSMLHQTNAGLKPGLSSGIETMD